MKRIIAAIGLLFLLSGCAAGQTAMDTALHLRQQMQRGCTFEAVIAAEYESSIQTFTLSCSADAQGAVSFLVEAPQVISGISGTISSDGGIFRFDDGVVEFEPLAEGRLSPAAAPWVLVHTLLSGYITSCEDGKVGVVLSIDDSYQENAMGLNITLSEKNLPVCAEIIWNQRRILSMEIRNFTIL